MALIVGAGAAHAGGTGTGTGTGIGAGIELRPQASTADLGLPAFPGATRRIDPNDDGNGLTFSLWGGSHGFKLVVLKYASDAPIERISRFYRDALGRYGDVLDCSPPQPAPPSEPGKPKVLRCDEAQPEPGTRLFKAGTPDHQHVASLKQAGDQVQFDLLRIDMGAP